MIIFDIEPLQNKDYIDRGIGRYARNLISCAEGAGFEFKFTYNPKLPLPVMNRLAFTVDFMPATRANMEAAPASWLVTLSPFEKSLGETARLFRSCNPSGKVATVVYDLIPMVFEQTYLVGDADRLNYRICLESMMSSDVLLSISEHTKRDIESILHPKCPVVNIGTGVDNWFFQDDQLLSDDRWNSFLLKIPELRAKKYIFTVSGGHRTKNLPTLLEAYAACPLAFRMAHPLVIGGGMPAEARMHFQNDWENIIRKTGGERSNIILLPQVTDVELRMLYNRCRAFVYASLYEGFGLPLAEALVGGSVCVSSNASSLREILPVEGYTFAPNDVERMSSLIVKALTDEDYRQAFKDWAEVRRSSLTWASVGEKLRQALPERADAEPAGSGKGRIAIVSPTHPARTGIADYNAKLGPDILEDKRFTFFSSNDALPVGAGLNAYPASLIKEVWPKFSHFVYVIGNSYQHIEPLNHLNRHPGYVWLHDVGLRGLAWDIARQTTPHDPWQTINEMLRSYPGVHHPVLDMRQLEASPCNFVKPILQNALGFIVHSEHAKRLLQEDLGAMQDRRPICVIPHAVPSFPGARPETIRDDRRIIVGMTGFMAPIRSPELTIDAIGLLPRNGRSLTARIIGNCGDGLRAELLARCKKLDIELEVTGYLEEDAFLAQTAAIDVVVQLRQRSNGESSGTVANALALGVPIVTNIPSALEFWGTCLISAPGIPTAVEVAERINLALDPGYRQSFKKNVTDVMSKFSFFETAKLFIGAVDALNLGKSTSFSIR